MPKELKRSPGCECFHSHSCCHFVLSHGQWFLLESCFRDHFWTFMLCSNSTLTLVIVQIAWPLSEQAHNLFLIEIGLFMIWLPMWALAAKNSKWTWKSSSATVNYHYITNIAKSNLFECCVELVEFCILANQSLDINTTNPTLSGKAPIVAYNITFKLRYSATI